MPRPVEEIWKDISEYEGYYQVSTFGRIKSLNRVVQTARGSRFVHGRVLKPELCKSTGYMYVNLHRDGKLKHCTIHRIVAQTFITNPNCLPVVNHKDENRTNNRVDNLEWITNEDNLRYSDSWHRGARNRRDYNGSGNPFYGKHHTDVVKKKCGKATRGKIAVNDGIKRKMIMPEELEYYLSKGYKRGNVR